MTDFKTVTQLEFLQGPGRISPSSDFIKGNKA